MLWFASITWSILWKFYSQNMSNIFKRLNMNKSGHLPQDRCDDKMVCVCRRIIVCPFSVVDWYYASRLIGLEHNLTVYLICILYTLVIDYLVERGSTAHTRRSIIGYFFFLSLYWHNCLNERSRTNDTRANRSTSERRLPSHSAVLCRRTSFLPLSFSLSLNSSSLLRSIPFFPYPPHRLIPPTSIPVSSILSLKISSFFSSPTYCCCDCTSWTTWLACFLLVVFAVVFSPIFTRSIENLSRRCRQQPTEQEFTFTNSVHWVIASSWESRLWLWNGSSVAVFRKWQLQSWNDYWLNTQPETIIRAVDDALDRALHAHVSTLFFFQRYDVLIRLYTTMTTRLVNRSNEQL